VVAHGETGLLVPPPFASSVTGFASVSPSQRFWFGGPGYYPPAQNVSALADAILTLLDNRSQSAAMGQRGRGLALERYSWPKYLAELSRLYDRVLSDRVTDRVELAPAAASLTIGRAA
jgi:glycosyltransferase involved in cell wall biosynthesis